MIVARGAVRGARHRPGDLGRGAARRARRDLAIGTHLAIVFMFTLGALLSTNEYRHGTANSTFVVTPKRERVVAAKLGVGLRSASSARCCYIAVNARPRPVDPVLARASTSTPTSSSTCTSASASAIVLGCLFGVALGHAAAQPDPHRRRRDGAVLPAAQRRAVHRQRRRRTSRARRCWRCRAAPPRRTCSARTRRASSSSATASCSASPGYS